MRQLFLLATAALAIGTQASAESVVAARAIRSHTLLTRGDMVVSGEKHVGALSSIEEAIGFETRRNIYPGHPIRQADLGPPALIERNDVVTIHFVRGGLSISTEGRALDRAGIGETLRVMNLDSRIVITGRVREDGTVEVGA